MRTDTKTLIAAMWRLTRDISCEDGVAAIGEAAMRLEELDNTNARLRQKLRHYTGGPREPDEMYRHLVVCAVKHGEISESRAAELLGMMHDEYRFETESGTGPKHG